MKVQGLVHLSTREPPATLLDESEPKAEYVESAHFCFIFPRSTLSWTQLASPCRPERCGNCSAGRGAASNAALACGGLPLAF